MGNVVESVSPPQAGKSEQKISDNAPTIIEPSAFHEFKSSDVQHGFFYFFAFNSFFFPF